MRRERAFGLVVKALAAEIEVIVALLVLRQLGVVLERRELDRCTALPATKESGAEQLASLVPRQPIDDYGVVVKELVEFRNELLELTVTVDIEVSDEVAKKVK